MNKILEGNSLIVLKTLAENSVDAIVTDPPYELGFMGKKWDSTGIAYNVELWKECLRVIKPGGHLLSFGGTRTQHRMVCAIEDAGFEIRDTIMWVYGSGFPKSLNIGKAIDKLQGNEGVVINQKTYPDIRNNNYNNSHGKTMLCGGDYSAVNKEYEGWGTALKPAHEPIVVARKPLSEKTCAKNVLKWGTGGINIDECRIHLRNEKQPTGSAKRVFSNNSYSEEKKYGENKETSHLGRYPANLIHDGSDEVLELFPQTNSGAMKKAYKYTNNGFSLGKPTGETKQIHEKNSGSAARFFYCAKASKSERNRGCENVFNLFEQSEGLEEKFSPTLNDGIGVKEHNPATATKKTNHHPTVKPVTLIEYLIKLVSKENDIVLDLFAGSGTTAIACIKLKRNYILIENKAEYLKIIRKRVEQFKQY